MNQKLLYRRLYHRSHCQRKLQSQMENLNSDAYFPGWHEERVTSISDDDVQVF